MPKRKYPSSPPASSPNKRMNVVPYVARAAARRMSSGAAARIIQRAARSSILRNAAIAGATSLSNRIRSRMPRIAPRIPTRKSRGTQTVNTGRSGTVRSYANGRYVGGFSKTRKVKKPNNFLRKGFVHTHEIHGIVSDQDCVYVGVSASSNEVALEMVAHALLRRLFEKCIKQPINNIKAPLQGFWNGTAGYNSDGFKLELEYVNISTGALGYLSYETVAPSDSIYSIVGEAAIPTPVAAGWPALMTAMRGWCTSAYATADNLIAPVKLHIYRKDGNVTAFWVHSGCIDLRTVKVHYHAKAAIKIQNRSLAADAGNDADNVTANPLQGYQYEFNSGCPAYKDNASESGSFRLNRMFDVGGVITARGSNMTGAASVLKEPPKPQLFMNCVKSSKVKLDPGSLKYATVSFSINKMFIAALKTIGLQQSLPNILGQYYRNDGRSKLFAFEDMINVNQEQQIAIAYEINRESMCYITEHPNTSSQGYFTQFTYNDV